MKHTDTLTPRELFAELSAMPRPHRVVDFPRKHPVTGEPVGQVALWPLTQTEQIHSAIAADKLIREHFQGIDANRTLGYEASYSNAVCVEILWRACRNPRDLDRPAFPSAKDLRSVVTPDEAGLLFEAYLEMVNDIGPIIATMTRGDLDAWIQRLLVGGQQIDPLASFSSGMLRVLVRALAERLRNSTTDTSSVGLPLASFDDDTLEPTDKDSLS